MIFLPVMLPSFYKQPATFIGFLLLNIWALSITTSMGITFGANNTDHLALLAIKSEITRDPRSFFTSWNDTLDFCQWQGVTCGHRHKRVTALNLSSKDLGGSLSPYIGNLSFLREVQLQNNTLAGGIPPEVGRLVRLQLLRLNNNSFGGEIPANLSRCTSLVLLNLGYNNLVGKIPEELGSLSMLKTLGTYYNILTGGIPHSIGNLTSLQNVSLAGCHLRGTIPDTFHRLKNLRTLGLGMNDLVGTIPSSFYNLSLLYALDVGDNQISGSLPRNLGLMFPTLQILRLGNNTFTGSLPPSISNCSELTTIDFSLNNFNGKIAINFGGLHNLVWLFLAECNLGSGEPDEMKFIDSLSNCTDLDTLELANNRLRGVLPNSLGNFSNKFSYLSLKNNLIFGSLPSSIGNLIGLTVLSLAENQFTGTIPVSIGNLNRLQSVLLWKNHFTGKIPASIGNVSLLLELYIANNNLEGTIPSSLGNCHQLTALSLCKNNLSRSIPKQIFQLTSLTIALCLDQNHFTGLLPPEVGNLKNLNKLSLFGNNLSGELPSSLGSCTNLELLLLNDNFFQGSIPSSLSSLKALQYLDLSANNFSGPIPKFFEHIPFLYLNLSFNNFQGEISMEGAFANSSVISIQGNNRLCGGIPELQLPKCKRKGAKGQHKLLLALIVSISILSTLLIATMVAFVLFRWFIRKTKDHPLQSSLKQSFEKVSYEQLLRATEGFSSHNLIGAGSFASVYKGVLDEEGGMVVAVKIINLLSEGGPKSFITECEALRKIRHRNLLRVITCCSSVDFQGNDFKAIVYEFMPNRSLEAWIHISTRTLHVQDELHHLSLHQRIGIAVDVASAIDYLHHHCTERIVHCDLKPSNILLDKDMVAHVGDFGLAKFLFPDHLKNQRQSSSIGIRGTVGYAAPEYGLGSEVSTSGDVYSYGILLLEMVIGKKPTDPIFQDGLNLHKYANKALADHCVLDIVDPILLQDDGEDEELIPPIASSNQNIEQARNHIDKEECLALLIKVGVACSKEAPQDRMDISHVINELQLVKGRMSKTYQSVVPNASRTT